MNNETLMAKLCRTSKLIATSFKLARLWQAKFCFIFMWCMKNIKSQDVATKCKTCTKMMTDMYLFPREARDLDLVFEQQQQQQQQPSKMLERWFFLRFWAARDAMGFVRGGFIEISAAPWRNGRFARESAHTQRRQKRYFWCKNVMFEAKTLFLTQQFDFDAKKRDFLPSGACLESKFMILMQQTWLFAQRSVP